MVDLVEQKKKSNLELPVLLTEMKDCTRCFLRKGCNQVVTGTGPSNASLLILGEAPGYDEDIIGEPFVGQSGQLLNKLLKKAGLDRDTIYITNTVKCRPKRNATPDNISIDACKLWLWKELQNINPLIILTLGKVPTKLLLKMNTTFKMSDVAGKSYDVTYIQAKIIPWYHPSYLLRQGRSLDNKTIDFFVKVKEQINVK